MKSWVYIFSKFTNEALLFEALGICVLCAGYAAFYVLRKRRLGVIQSEVPSGVVKTYLNMLILDAEQLRAQLFGLLASTGGTATQRIQLPTASTIEIPAGLVASGAAADPELQSKVGLLENKMAEQSRAMDAIVSEKTRLERELLEAKSKSSSGGGGVDSSEIARLNEKIANLEGKLAEYSVIEDDLANLKRLQQENAQLKAMLEGKGGAAPTPSPAAAAAPAPAPSPAAEASSPLDDLLKTGASTEAAFDNLAGQVDESLQASKTDTAAAPAAAQTPSAPAMSKLDEDLVAEFEKMLNS